MKMATRNCSSVENEGKQGEYKFSSLYDSSTDKFWILSNNESGVVMELLKY